ncbi:hypothetical protein [Mycobacterium sp. SMC-4]|uniref:hypothetical protein n=1 Tax=Mycobacterium sp. SMC-4 TaxID=2857059 RepID=UPI0021B2CA7F|nr:hypothetical protein [Mycobacterium sp. SMC-4]UXA16748.1 hypothetical protein KXD98_18450 [Mycobacterium sp. SMC-4]
MRDIVRHSVFGVMAVAPLASMLLVAPGPARAAECGAGTVYDPPTDTCVVAPAPPPPPPPPPPPAWNGDLTPGFSIGICAPIPFVALCTGI